MSEVLSGAEFKKQLRAGVPKLGLFVNSHSPTVAEQLAHSGYDWLLIDTQHGPMNNTTLSTMLAGVSSGGAKSLVRVAGYQDRAGIQQSLDMGADGVLVPYINNAEEARQAVSCTRYPTAGTRSVYFPQRSMNKAGLLGYAGNANANVITALQVETADCIKNMDEIAAVPGVDMLFLGQNDLCMSMGLAMTLEDSWGGDVTTAAIAHLAHSTPEEYRFTSTDFNSYVTVSTADGAPRREQGFMAASAAPQINGGQLSVGVDVSVTFAIGG